MACFINSAVFVTEEAAVLLSSAEAPKVFLDPGIRRDCGLYHRIERRMLDCGVSLLPTSSWVRCRHFGGPEEIGKAATLCGRPPR